MPHQANSAASVSGIDRRHPSNRAADFHMPGLNCLWTGTARFWGVIPEIDIWRAAQLMLKRYRPQALAESAARAAELASSGDGNGAATWRRIVDAVTQLDNTIPPGPLR
jgi:hypothetical protein